MRQNTNEQLSADQLLAERVRQQLSVFTEKFAELEEGGELRRLMRTPHTLSGPKVEQQPEDFTEQYLIEPILHGLGYWNPISDEYDGEGPHFVRRPSTFRKIEVKRPDYLLKNVSSTTICILEAKAANNEQLHGKKRKATEDIREYVQSDTFSKYLKTLDQRYLIAIGTDGLRWVLWAKDVRSRDTRDAIVEVDLSDAIETIAKRNGVIEGEPEFDAVSTRKLLQTDFVPAFSARYINSYVAEEFE